MPKLIDADKLEQWLKDRMDNAQNMYAVNAYDRVRGELMSGTFDPTPPVQPDIKPGDRVRHLVYKKYGIGEVKEIARSGKQAYVEWPNFDEKKCDYAPTPAYYRLDKLEVIPDDPST